MSEDIKQFTHQQHSLTSVQSPPIHLSPLNVHSVGDTVGSSPVGSFSSLSVLDQQHPSPGTAQHMFTWSNVTSSSSPTSSNEWVKMIDCGEFIGPKRSKHTMVNHNDSLYVFGGDNGKQMLNDIIIYDCKSNGWSRGLNISSRPSTRYHHTAVVYNSSMFVFGGYTGDLNSNTNLCNKNDLYEYKTGSGNWVLWNTENAPAARAAHGAVVYDHKLWVFAGYDGNARLNDMWYIPLNQPAAGNNVWTEVDQTGDQPSTVCNSPLCVVQDSMYLFSGQSGAKTSNHLFKFDFKTFSWNKMKVLNFILRGTDTPPERRSGHIMVAHNNHLYIYGGVLGNNFFHDIYSFDLETKTWDLITINPKSPIPSGRSFLSAAVYNDHLYVFGGNGEENTRSNELYKFKLPNQPKSTLKDDFLKLLKKEMFCDLKFICSDKQVILAHCAILAARSSYCRQLIKLAKEKMHTASLLGTRPLSSNETHRTSSPKIVDDASSRFNLANASLPPFTLSPGEYIEIKINGENSEALKLVLEFLYTDRIMSLEGKEHELDTVKLMVDVYKIANQFIIPKLKKICVNFIDSSITCCNVLNLLRYVDTLNLFVLKELCMKFVVKDVNFNQVIMMPEFEQLNQALMVEIIRLKQTPRKSTNPDQPVEILIEPSTNLEQDLAAFLKKDYGNEYSDVLILLEENTPPIHAHMCILAARCAYFEAYFRSFMPKDRRVLMAIGDTIPPLQACVSLLRYIYYDDVYMPPQDALYLFSASHFFQFSNLRLHVFCKQNLEVNVSKSNVFDILEAADKINDEYMKNFALKIVRTNFHELSSSIRIKRLSKELLLDIMADIGNNMTNKSINSPSNSIASMVSANSSATAHQSPTTSSPLSNLSFSALPAFTLHLHQLNNQNSQSSSSNSSSSYHPHHHHSVSFPLPNNGSNEDSQK